MPAATSDDANRIGPFELDRGGSCLRRDGELVKLGARAFDVLAALAAQRGSTVSKAMLLDTVWPDVVVEENNLQVQVSTLRKLLGPNAIATIPGRGYRLTAADASDAAVEAGEAAEAGEAVEAVDTVRDPQVGNLPPQTPTLIARDRELERLAREVDACKLVTVVGPGGIGKTRLALAVAHDHQPRWRDGVWLVELAPVTDGASVPQVVAQALHLPLNGAQDPLAALVQALAPQSMLVVLDNCEHLLESVGPLSEALGRQASGVHLLATSQELLNVAHEHVFPLGPLALPPAGESHGAPGTISAAGAAGAAPLPGALALFVERARAADPRFALGPDNADAVVEICRRLDGLPLVIELAAARVRHLGVFGLRDKLDDRFRLLTGGHRTAMPRHRTLRATIEWSCSLLSEPERQLLHRLAVFVGGFALDQLAEAGQMASVLARHAQVVHGCFDAADEARFGAGGRLSGASYQARLVPETDNLRAAMGWLMDRVKGQPKGQDGDPAVAMALSLVGASRPDADLGVPLAGGPALDDGTGAPGVCRHRTGRRGPILVARLHVGQ